MLRRLLARLSPAGEQGRLSVLIFHRVLSEPDPIHRDGIDAAGFDRLCGWLTALFNVLPLDEAVVRMKAGTLPQRALSITFDDGYANAHDVALPILLRHRLSATFFITTGALDGGCMWNDVVDQAIRHTSCGSLDLRRLGVDGLQHCRVGNAGLKRTAIMQINEALKYRPVQERLALAQQVATLAGVQPSSQLMLSSEQVRGLFRAGMQIGAHTVSHAILAKLQAAQAFEEVSHSRQTLESILDEKVELFAYPNGKWGKDYDAQTVGIVREAGFAAAFTTDWGVAGSGTDAFHIPRFTPWDRTRPGFGLRMAANLRRGMPWQIDASPDSGVATQRSCSSGADSKRHATASE